VEIPEAFIGPPDRQRYCSVGVEVTGEGVADYPLDFVAGGGIEAEGVEEDTGVPVGGVDLKGVG